MNIKVNAQEGEYFNKLLTLLNPLAPFDQLGPSEIAVYAELLELNYKYRKIPYEERSLLIMSGENKISVAKSLNIKLSRVYNVMTKLRKIGILDSSGIVPKYALGKYQKVTFIFNNSE